MNGISLGTWLCPCGTDRLPGILSTSLFAFSPKDLYKECVGGFLKGGSWLWPLSLHLCCWLPRCATTTSTRVHGQLTSLSPEETCMLNFKPGVIKIAQQFGRRGDDRSCNWQQAQPHTTWMWKNRLGFESGVAEARHTFSAAEKLATS